MLVSGVRSSCEASATKSRWRSSAASLSPRAALSSLSMSSRVWARSDTSSLARGLGSVTSGSRVRATSRAARVSPAIGRMARRATNSPPREGEEGAADHAEGEEQAHLVHRARHAALGLPVLDVGERLRPPGGRGRRRSSERGRVRRPRAAGRPPGRRPRRATPSGGGRARGPRCRSRDTRHAALVHDPHRGVAGARRTGAAPRRSSGVTSPVGLDLPGDAVLEAVLEVGRGGPEVVVEAGADALLGHRADHDREEAEDRERERRARRSPP